VVHVSGFWKESGRSATSYSKNVPIGNTKNNEPDQSARGSPKISRIILVWLQITNVKLCPFRQQLLTLGMTHPLNPNNK
jgi:hypothetical protein